MQPTRGQQPAFGPDYIVQADKRQCKSASHHQSTAKVDGKCGGYQPQHDQHPADCPIAIESPPTAHTQHVNAKEIKRSRVQPGMAVEHQQQRRRQGQHCPEVPVTSNQLPGASYQVPERGRSAHRIMRQPGPRQCRHQHGDRHRHHQREDKPAVTLKNHANRLPKIGPALGRQQIRSQKSAQLHEHLHRHTDVAAKPFHQGWRRAVHNIGHGPVKSQVVPDDQAAAQRLARVNTWPSPAASVIAARRDANDV